MNALDEAANDLEAANFRQYAGAMKRFAKTLQAFCVRASSTLMTAANAEAAND